MGAFLNCETLSLAVIVAIVVWVAYCRIEIWLIDRNPYKEGRAGYAKVFIPETIYAVTTPIGFTVNLRIVGEVTRVNDATFKKHDMLMPGVLEAKFSRYVRNEVSKLFAEKRWFCAWRVFEISESSVPSHVGQLGRGALLFRVLEDGTVRGDSGGFDMKKVLAESPYNEGGCRFGILQVHIEPTERQPIVENYNMLTPEQRAHIISKSDRYNQFYEKVAIMELKELRDRHERCKKAMADGIHSGSGYSVRTERVGELVRVHWKFEKDQAQGRWLLGFRRVGSFHPNMWALDGESDGNGQRIVESNKNGEIGELLVPGTQYFYTFFLRGATWKGEADYSDPVRFMITVLTDAADEVDSQIAKTLSDLADQSARRNAPPVRSAEEIRNDKRFDEVMADFKLHMSVEDAITKLKAHERFAAMSVEYQDQYIERVRRRFHPDDLRMSEE